MADHVKNTQQSHFVLVHGSCHGAWCWYKVKPLLESAGHRVTVLDLAASGIDPREIQDVPTFYEYTEPLLKLLVSLPQNEKVVIVSHSFGGIISCHSVELAKTLVRPSSLYLHDLSKARSFSEEKYGSVTRVYVVCDEDKIITPQFQQWMIANNPVDGVMEINGADHMPMFSKPQNLSHCLSEIALRYT